MSRFIIAILFGLGLASSPTIVGADTISGRATVIDGDTIQIRGQRVRLWGIDAPEARQQCQNPAGRTYPCGRIALEALKSLIGNRRVTCTVKDYDRYQCAVAQCYVGDVDMSQWMAEHGHAPAFRRYSHHYIPAEEQARAQHAGMWAGGYIAPPEQRYHRDDASPDAR